MAGVNASEYTVYAPDGKGGTVVVGPGQSFPKGVKVGNPLVTGKSTVAAVPTDPDEDEDGDKPEPPPQSGKGSGEPEWRAYADELGEDVSDLENRAAIIDYLDGKGHRV